MLSESIKLSIKVTLIYWITGSLWIILSDRYAEGIDSLTPALNNVQTYKGLFYVSVTASLLFLIIQKLTNQLIKNDEQYRMMFTTNPTPMWIYDSETLRFIAVNQAALSTYGYTREEFRNLTIRDIRPKDELKHLEKALEEIKENQGVSHTMGWKHLTKKGDILDVEIISHDMIFNGRKCRLVMAINMTEKLKHLHEISILNTNLIKKAEQIRLYSFVNSHKIRKPLANILSLVDVMKAENALNNNLSEMITESALELEKEIQDMNRILSNQQHETN